jgi:DNA repair exonuclease SbcCD ATPase subunit
MNLRKSLDAKKTELQLHIQSEQKHIQTLSELEKESKLLQEAREIFQKAAILTQNHLATHLSTIVTKALRVTFYEKDVQLKVEFVERRNVAECDMWIEEDGYKYSLLESRGFGMTDIVSFALRVAYILLHNSDNVLVIDEPFRNLSEDKHEGTSQMIKELSKELGIQFIISTHVPTLKEYADKAFFVKQKDGISIIY